MENGPAINVMDCDMYMCKLNGYACCYKSCSSHNLHFWRQESFNKGLCPVGAISRPGKHNSMINEKQNIMYLEDCVVVVGKTGLCLEKLRGGRNLFPIVGFASGRKAHPNIENSLKKTMNYAFYITKMCKVWLLSQPHCKIFQWDLIVASVLHSFAQASTAFAQTGTTLDFSQLLRIERDRNYDTVLTHGSFETVIQQ